MYRNLTVAKIKHYISTGSMFWVLQLVGWGVFGLIIYAIKIIQTPSSGITLSQKLTFIAFGFLLTIPLYVIYRSAWKLKWKWLKLIGLLIVSSCTAAGLWMLACEVFVLKNGAGYIFQLIAEHPEFVAENYLHSTITMLSWSSVFIGSFLWKDLETQKKHALETQHQLNKARLQALRYQLNPHFLFNVLNSIHSVIHSEPEKAEKMVEELSDLLRYTLMENDDQTVTLEDELAIVNSYLAIEKIRFQERLLIYSTIDPDTKRVKIPALIILTLVENALKHGMKSSNGLLCIFLDINYSEQEELLINVSNTGSLEALNSNGHIIDKKRTKIGLENIRCRLRQQYGAKSNLVLHEDSGWVHVKMKITNVNTI